MKPETNHLFRFLPAAVRERLRPGLSLVDLPLGKVLHKPGEANRDIYFPIDAAVSILYVTREGTTAGLAMIGNEGLVGVSSFMSGSNSPHLALVHNPGNGYRLPGEMLNEAFGHDGDARRLLLLYTQSIITQIAQTVVCNRHHTIYQQLSRWLLLSLDRLPGNHVTSTQEMIAGLLGVRREGVTIAAKKLQEEGVIDYVRGKITVPDRARLEQSACECYSVVKRETLRLLPDLPWRVSRTGR